MYGTNSEDIIKSANKLINDYGMKPLAAYDIVYQQSAKMAEVFELIAKQKKALNNRMVRIK